MGMKTNFSKRLIWLHLVVLAGCLEPYQAPELNNDLNSLVVDGFIDITDQTATVRLSRTSKLSTGRSFAAEPGAQVSLEESGQPILTPLVERPNGVYVASGLQLNLARQYRLHISTTQGRSYVSDDIVMKQSPPIDSVYWKAGSDGVHLYVDTHDPTSQSGYYSWDYQETWQNDAFFDPIYKALTDTIVERTPGERTYSCWTTKPSTGILISSTRKLSDDAVRGFQILFIPRESAKLFVEYSIEVRQQVLTESSYQFWEGLKKTTESIGGLFDPLPYQLVGNVHNLTNPNEFVMGYVSGGATHKQRIFIDIDDLPDDLKIAAYATRGCKWDTVTTLSYGMLLATNEKPFRTAAPSCIDCRTEGGTNVKPPFWH
jgi:hypothetical protein